MFLLIGEEMTPESELERLFPAKPIDPKETAEDRWEFNQQSEALYQARLEAKAAIEYPEPPRPATPTKQSPFRNWQPGWLKSNPPKNPKLPAKI